MNRTVLFFIGIVLLIGVEIARVFFIMPFPGSQRSETIEIAYFLHTYIVVFRVIGLVLIAFSAYQLIRQPKLWLKSVVIALLGFWLVVAFMFNFRFKADKMFYQPESKILTSVVDSKIPVKQLILGVTLNGESKAYPIEIIGYHHQVRDTVGGQGIMVTYCTVCRTGRVFNPVVEGQPEVFRLVGMDHFNAMFEDSKTGTWWRQVNGEAIIGPLKGKQLKEIPSEQMTLAAWISRHPDTKILQEDSVFKEEYIDLAEYDEGKKKGSLERKDSISWSDKSWVVGIQIGMEPRAYDWIELLKDKVINDQIGSASLLVAVESDSANFHVWQRPDTLQFSLNDNFLIDDKTNSRWDWSGKCVEGELVGTSLENIQSYQEYWHSWRTFRPQTTQYKKD
ncbi:MAG TPA: DUF3179 domain-containing (seleno)protein [Cyclobacteriaceae bacterium]|nr:DUF3179 domain-containing (seleno)protein [Cyclobacteriaceae bacterium]